jgi:hypothetical protein
MFLCETQAVAPLLVLIILIEPRYPKRARRLVDFPIRWPLLLRIHLQQHW